MVDASHVGLTGEPFTMVVERGKLREFARAVYADSGDPELAEVALPTFLSSAHHWRTPAQYPWSRIGWDDARGLHAEEEYDFPGGPPRAGTELHGQSRIDDVYVKTGRRGGELTFAIMGTRFTDPTGHVVAEARMTGVLTAHEPAPRTVEQQDADAGPATAEPAVPGGSMVVGPVTRTDFVRYAGASGDFIALHHDEIFAQRAGFPTVVGQGMFGAGLLGTLAARWRGAAQVRRFRVRFLGQFWPDDTLSCRVETRTVRDTEHGPETELVLGCRRQTGEAISRAWVTIAGDGGASAPRRVYV